MKPPPQDNADALAEAGLDYYTELTRQYLEDLREAKPLDIDRQADRSVVWFEFEGVEMSVSVYLGHPAVTVGGDTRIPYKAFQENAAWIIRTCADFGLGIDLDVDGKSGETWMFLFMRIFWAGYNYEVLTAACDDLLQCRKALEGRLPLSGKRKEKKQEKEKKGEVGDTGPG